MMNKKGSLLFGNERHMNFFHHSSFIIHHSSFIIHHSSFIIHHSSFIIHHSSFIIHHSSFIIHHSSFIIHHYSLLTFTSLVTSVAGSNPSLSMMRWASP